MSFFFDQDLFTPAQFFWSPVTTKRRGRRGLNPFSRFGIDDRFMKDKMREFDRITDQFWRQAENDMNMMQSTDQNFLIEADESDDTKQSRGNNGTRSLKGSDQSQALTTTGGGTQLITWPDRNPLLKDNAMRLDVVDNSDNYVITAAVPGFDKTNLKLEFNNGLLTLSGQQITEVKSDDGNSYSKSSRMISKSVRLAEPIIRENAQAIHNNESLIITLPKQTRTNQNQIQIQ